MWLVFGSQVWMYLQSLDPNIFVSFASITGVLKVPTTDTLWGHIASRRSHEASLDCQSRIVSSNFVL